MYQVLSSGVVAPELIASHVMTSNKFDGFANFGRVDAVFIGNQKIVVSEKEQLIARLLMARTHSQVLSDAPSQRIQTHINGHIFHFSQITIFEWKLTFGVNICQIPAEICRVWQIIVIIDMYVY